MRSLAMVAALTLAGIGLVHAATAVEEGRRSYLRYCASCHGTDGSGDGPLAPELRTPPADLTGIRARRGGRFPFSEIRKTIDGRAQVRFHGPREMPVWGKRFAEQAGGGPGSEIRVDAEITALLAFLESIQRPVDPDSTP